MVEDKEQRIETLQDRVDELEATVSKMLPSRRDALKLGAAGAVGAVGMAGSASAQNSNQVGTIGTDSDRVDVNAEDIDAVSVNTDDVTIGPHNITPDSEIVADDSAVTFSGYEAALTFWINAGGPDNQALFVSGFKELETAAALSSVTNQGRTALSGTTGPDGNLNIARDGADIIAENRLGDSRTVYLFPIELE